MAAAMPRATTGYAVLGTQRSGSTHLCALLESTGLLGRPREYFNIYTHDRMFPGLRRDAPIWDQMVGLSRTDNGVFATKVFARHFDDYPEIIPHVLELPLIFISRNDKLGQAISLSRARQSGRWTAAQVAREDAQYDFASISECLRHTLYSEAFIELNIASRGKSMLRVAYEDYLQSPQTTIDAIAAMMGVERAPAVANEGLAVQRDDTNAVWRQRYIEEYTRLKDGLAFDPFDYSPVKITLKQELWRVAGLLGQRIGRAVRGR